MQSDHLLLDQLLDQLPGQLPIGSPPSILKFLINPYPSENFKAPPYWHEDGDIYLIVEDDNGTNHKFRVHRVMLSLHSAVFRDMFTLGEKIVKEEGDVPAAPMKGDSVEDVREMLKLMYKGVELYYVLESIISFKGALGVLRLSHKYQMEGLKNLIVELLKRSWPLNYTEYNRVIASLSPAQKRNRIKRSIQLINAARLIGCYELLPPAFFELSNSDCTTWTSEVDGAEFLCPEDWLRLMKGKGLWMKRVRMLANAEPSDCEAYIWRRNAREQVSIFQARPAYGSCSGYNCAYYDDDVRYCSKATECLGALVGRAVLHGDSFIVACSYWTVESFSNNDVCANCARWMVSLIKNKEIEIWENVTADFDLPEVDEDEYTRTSSNRSFF